MEYNVQLQVANMNDQSRRVTFSCQKGLLPAENEDVLECLPCLDTIYIPMRLKEQISRKPNFQLFCSFEVKSAAWEN